jgi:hypothetical protein
MGWRLETKKDISLVKKTGPFASLLVSAPMGSDFIGYCRLAFPGKIL